MDTSSGAAIKTGYNINNKIDISKIVIDFINFYISNLNINNIQGFIDSKIIREYTTIKCEEDTFKGDTIIPFLQSFSNYTTIINKFNFLPSGSRRVDVSILATMSNESGSINFNQTFVLCHQDDSWYIKNSIFFSF